MVKHDEICNRMLAIFISSFLQLFAAAAAAAACGSFLFYIGCCSKTITMVPICNTKIKCEMRL